jgi:four helix bundle protein
VAASPVRSFRDLKVWQRALDLANECRAATEAFPPRRSAGLIAQIENSAGSVPANIAEGAGRRTTPDYLRHLSIANGSLLELETHLVRAAGFGLISPDRLAALVALCVEVGRMLAGLIRKLESMRDEES